MIAGTRFSAFTFLLLLFLSAPVRAETNVRFATDPWPPFFLDNNHAEINQGAGITIVQEIFARIPGAKARFPEVPWSRALHEVEKGEKDGIALLLKTEDRERFLMFSDPVIEVPALFYSRTESYPEGIQWQEFADLKGKKIGVVRGYSYGSAFDNAVHSGELNIIEATSSELLMRMLVFGRVDLIPENVVVAASIVRSNGWQDKVKKHEPPLDLDVLYIAISRKSVATSLMPQINAAIKTLRENGRIKAIGNEIGVPSLP